MKDEQVRDWMTADPITVTLQTTVPEAHRLLRDNDIRRLPVMENGRLVGIVTQGDVRNAEPPDSSSLSNWEVEYLLARVVVETIMTPDPWTVAPDSTIGSAAQKMLHYKIGGLPVVQSGRLAGIITESDILRLVLHFITEQTSSSES